MPNEHKRSTEIFRCSLNSLRKFPIVFCHFWVPYIFFKLFPWSGQLRKTWRVIEKNKMGNFFSVNLHLKRIQIQPTLPATFKDFLPYSTKCCTLTSPTDWHYYYYKDMCLSQSKKTSTI